MINPVLVETPYVWKGNFAPPKNYGEIKDTIEMLRKDKELGSSLETGDSFSTVLCNQYRPHKIEELLPFYSHLYKAIEGIYFQINESPRVKNHTLVPVEDTGFHWIKYTDGFHSTDKLFLIENSWFNIHYKGGRTIEHNHGDKVSFVCAYYLKVPENGGSFLIRSKDINRTPGPWRDYLQPIPVETGDFLIFPGHTNHASEENQSDEERIVITTNIVVNHF